MWANIFTVCFYLHLASFRLYKLILHACIYSSSCCCCCCCCYSSSSSNHCCCCCYSSSFFGGKLQQKEETMICVGKLPFQTPHHSSVCGTAACVHSVYRFSRDSRYWLRPRPPAPLSSSAWKLTVSLKRFA